MREACRGLEMENITVYAVLVAFGGQNIIVPDLYSNITSAYVVKMPFVR